MLEHKSLFGSVSQDPTEFPRALAATAKEHGVYFDEGIGLPVVVQTSEINAILRDAETFSTRVFQAGLMRDALVSQSGEAHTKMRKLYNSFFAPRHIKMYEQSIVEPVVREVVDDLAQRAQPDLIDDLAMIIPQRVVSALFGLPAEEIAKNDELVRTILAAIMRPLDEEIAAAGQRAYETIAGTLHEIAERELRSPSETMLGEIAKALTAEGQGDAHACERIVLTLILGSYETTIWGIASVLTALLRHPEALARVRDNLSLLPGAIEEAWRWCGSAIGTLRFVENEATVGGETLAAGTVLHIGFLAPHYDESLYPNPEVYDIERSAKTNIFGGGIHYCVGAPLARMETRVAITELLRRFGDLRADPDRPAPTFRVGTRGSIVFGPDHLPVVLGPSSQP